MLAGTEGRRDGAGGRRDGARWAPCMDGDCMLEGPRLLSGTGRLFMGVREGLRLLGCCLEMAGG